MTLPLLVNPVPKTNPDRTDWDVAGMTDFIKRRGYKMSYYKASLCPCRTEVSRQPDALCPLCLNRGDALTFHSEIPVMISTVNQKTGLETIGIWELGEAKATVEATVQIYEGDALVYKKYATRKREIMRPTGDVARLRFNFATAVESLSYHDEAVLDDVKDIDEAYYSGTASQEDKDQRETLLREASVVLEEGKDFRLVTKDNRSFIIFMGQKKPTPNKVVAINYLHNPEFVAIHQSMDDQDRDFQIARHHLVKLRDIADGDSSGDSPYQPKVVDDARVTG